MRVKRHSWLVIAAVIALAMALIVFIDAMRGARTSPEPIASLDRHTTDQGDTSAEDTTGELIWHDTEPWLDIPETASRDSLDKSSNDTTNEIQEAYHDAIVKALRAGSLENSVEHYVDFVEKYPGSPEAVRMMNVLGGVYARLGRIDEAYAVLGEALEQVDDDNFASILEISIAYVDIAANDFDAAEQTLLAVMEKPLPESFAESSEVAPQLFIAPTFLADVCRRTGRVEEADRLLREVGDLAWDMTVENPDVEWLPSYVAHSYVGRINLILETDPENVAAAYELAEEFEEMLPDYRGIVSYQSIIRSIQAHESSLHAVE